MKAIQPPALPTLYAKQREAVFAPARYSVIEASTKCGKTAGCLIWLLVKAWNEGKPGRNYWWVAPIFPQAKVAFSRLRRMLVNSDPQGLAWEKNESELWIQIRGHGRIWFKSADNPDGLYGDDVYDAVIDEASRCKEEAWHAVRSTLTATGGSVRIIGNVRGRKNWAYNLARRAESGSPDMAYFKLTAWDAVEGGILPKEEIEDAQRNLPERVFRELYLAEPADDGGNPFGIDAIKACVADTLCDPIPGRAYAMGLDLGKSQDYTVCCVIDVETSDVVALDRFQGDWGMQMLRIQSLASRYNRAEILVDSTGLGDPLMEQLQRMDYA